jgi:hypothetical protein
MNRSFDRLHLVNTYGAFGSVGRERDEIILEGTDDPHPGPGTVWRAYEFPCKPGDPMRRPCLISPYHYRLDWQLWFVPLSPDRNQRWFLSLTSKLLRGDARVLSLFAANPFPERPPHYVRASFYRYRFSGEGEPGVWQRTPAGQYLAPTSLDDPELARALRAYRLAD